MSWADSNNRKYGEMTPSWSRHSKRKGFLSSLYEKRRKEAEAKAKAEKEYASKQASVDTEISKTATGTNTGGRSAPRSVATGGSPKDDLRIKRKNYSSMYSGAGRNLV